MIALSEVISGGAGLLRRRLRYRCAFSIAKS